jgi:N-methylhydantoinase A
MKLDKKKAEDAVAKIAKKMNKDVIETAYAILKITNAQMADLIRKCTVERGFDPRNFSLIAYGGAGPTHVAFYSADVQARRIYVLSNATVFSAFGILTTPPCTPRWFRAAGAARIPRNIAGSWTAP